MTDETGRCDYCRAYVDDMNSDARSADIHGVLMLWCSDEHWWAWLEDRARRGQAMTR